MTDINTQASRTQNYKGFLQFIDPGAGSTVYRIKNRQNLAVTHRFIRDTSYSDDGTKVIDWAGKEHTFSLTMKLSADLFDDTPKSGSTPVKWTAALKPTETHTISYWIYQNEVAKTPLQITFLATAEAYKGPAANPLEKYIRIRFNMVPHTFGPIVWNKGMGTNEITIQGEIIETEYLTRSSSPPST